MSTSQLEDANVTKGSSHVNCDLRVTVTSIETPARAQVAIPMVQRVAEARLPTVETAITYLARLSFAPEEQDVYRQLYLGNTRSVGVLCAERLACRS